MSDKPSTSDENYLSSVGDSVSKNVSQTTDIVTNAAESQQAINTNKNASAGQKAVATGLNVAETGINAFGAVMGMTQKASEAVMMPMMKAMGGFRGMACLTVAKMFDPVMGVDVHMVMGVPPATSTTRTACLPRPPTRKINFNSSETQKRDRSLKKSKVSTA